MFNVQQKRKDFPILKTGIIYLDNAATSLTPEPVLQKIQEFYHEYRANTERGIHRLSEKATEEYERARAKVADFINAKSKSEVVMTRNATEGINLIAKGLDWKKGDKIVTSILEHHSNFIVWLRAKKWHNLNVKLVKPREPMAYGLLDPADFEKSIDDQTKLVAVTHVCHVLGGITPVKEITEIAHEHGAYVLIDGAQSVPHIKVDVQEIGCDFLPFSGHKMCGPTGSGGLYIREELTEEVEPLCVGGGNIADVSIDSYGLGSSPVRFEAGTPAIEGVIGLGVAVDYLKNIGMENIERYERKLVKRMYLGLSKIPKVEVYGPPPEQRVGIVPFNVGDLNSHDVALMLDVSADIMVRSGHHCALPLSKNIIGKSGSVRASAYFYNTQEEIEKLMSTVSEIAETLSR